MPRYYVNNTAQANGDHEVHKEGCRWIPFIKSKKDLGIHTTCYSAVREAKKTHPQSNGCIHCSKDCHTS
ncbi:hypothetical protein [uncultured Aquimarina sp.]|uniref:hypothetical protein n=1 Tax=uncultured Aquimarina sp. TaxID=575652 RepID=UPI002629C830|nr:hypothetical protein [uncultured Aquimarina sp.]